MSNQVSLMLSFIFLAIFILFSGELMAYQQISAKALALTNDIAVYVENYGYESDEEILHLEESEYFNEVYVESELDDYYGYTSYTITTIKKHKAFTEMFSYMSQDIVCNVTVCRKE